MSYYPLIKLQVAHQKLVLEPRLTFTPLNEQVQGGDFPS